MVRRSNGFSPPLWPIPRHCWNMVGGTLFRSDTSPSTLHFQKFASHTPFEFAMQLASPMLWIQGQVLSNLKKGPSLFLLLQIDVVSVISLNLIDISSALVNALRYFSWFLCPSYLSVYEGLKGEDCQTLQPNLR